LLRIVADHSGNVGIVAERIHERYHLQDDCHAELVSRLSDKAIEPAPRLPRCKGSNHRGAPSSSARVVTTLTPVPARITPRVRRTGAVGGEPIDDGVEVVDQAGHN
jgi:hypothetical protein